MTNGDRIRNMTDEELANFLSSPAHQPCTHCGYNDPVHGCLADEENIICDHDNVYITLKRWLSAQVSKRLENWAASQHHSPLGMGT